MDSVITFSSKRTFARSFRITLQLWFAAPYGYAFTAGLAAFMGYLFYDSGSPWMTALSGIAWVAVMLPLLLAAQAWKIWRWYRTAGQPTFFFDAEGATLKSGEVVVRVPWSGIKRILLTRRTCFLYLAPRVAWFFERDEVSQQDEQRILDFAKGASVTSSNSTI